MGDAAATFYPLNPAKYPGENRKSIIINIIVFYAIVVILLAFIMYAILRPSEYFQSKFANYPFFLLILVIYHYLFLKPPLPHQFKKSFYKKLTYTLEDEELVVYFNDRPIYKKRYDEMKYVEVLQEELKGVGGIRTVGRDFYLSHDKIAGTSKKFPNLFIYSTTLQEGIVIHCSYESIFLTPENKDVFREQLEKRIAGKKENLIYERNR